MNCSFSKVFAIIPHPFYYDVSKWLINDTTDEMGLTPSSCLKRDKYICDVEDNEEDKPGVDVKQVECSEDE